MKESGNKALAFPSPHPLHHPPLAKAGCNVRCKPEIYSDTRTAVKYSPRCDTPPHVPRLLSPGLPVCITHLSWYGTKKRAGHRLLAHPPRNTSTLAWQTASINISLRASTRPSSCRGSTRLCPHTRHSSRPTSSARFSSFSRCFFSPSRTDSVENTATTEHGAEHHERSSASLRSSWPKQMSK